MTETTFTTPGAMAEMQGRMAGALLEAADEGARRFETAVRETATALASVAHANAERSIEAMGVAAKLRARSVEIARAALATPAAK